ncbi:hypothetical protein GCM10007108_09650 [Thermogymnomonas acidicola]|uniref:ATPase BadF/BadG/BcrA/BcrD type domain-containing protein n=1 Tax=Thermogymnomonas acidicola TaxID=399579 RepID=A0AA37BRC3_9ARCH|nr:BadF/BadG/BcrA/BcrD ATPase family protein [Thermogymnomonas acidicola]GGM73762.1 hypothetical protein GCM10007108_09650 [Thermogymnomonas acidicola]
MLVSVDGGATKTVAILYDESEDSIVSCGVSGPSNFTSVPEEVAVQNILKALEMAGISSNPVRHFYFGLAGVGDSQKDTETGKRICSRVSGGRPFIVENDGSAAYFLANMSSDGFVFAGGTGSVCFVQKDGELKRLAGWGWLCGDEASGYWFGLRALNLATREADGIMESRDFVRLVEGHYGLPLRDAISEAQRNFSKRRIAALAPGLVDIARMGNREADKVLEEASGYIASLLHSSGVQGSGDVSVLGGTMLAGEAYLKKIRKRVGRALHYFYGYQVAVGGLMRMMQNLGLDVDRATRDRFLRELDDRISSLPRDSVMENLFFAKPPGRFGTFD